MTTAVRIHDHSGTPVLEEVELPEPGPREVRVDLTHAGVNPVDGYLAKGLVAPDGPVPRTLGGEAAGTVDGRPVLVTGMGLGASRDGLWADAAVVPREAVMAVPRGVGSEQVASVGIAGLTAWSAVVECARVDAADRVLVLGAAGGVGLPVVSLAASLGAEVWAVVRHGDREAAVRAVGASGVLVAAADELAEAAAELEPTVVIDPLAGDFVAPSLDVLAARGRYVLFGVSAGREVSLNWQNVYRRGLSVLGFSALILDPAERRRRLAATLSALAEGRMQIPVARTVPLADGGGVFDLPPVEARGKTVLTMT